MHTSNFVFENYLTSIYWQTRSSARQTSGEFLLKPPLMSKNRCLPWFLIETPIGKYHPDWAILKHDNSVLYLVRETKSTKILRSFATAK